MLWANANQKAAGDSNDADADKIWKTCCKPGERTKTSHVKKMAMSRMGGKGVRSAIVWGMEALFRTGVSTPPFRTIDVSGIEPGWRTVHFAAPLIHNILSK